MSKRTLQFVIYLLLSISIGLSVVMVTYNLENIVQEKKLRYVIKQEFKNAIATFKDSSPGAHADQTLYFLRKYVGIVMERKLIAVDTAGADKPDKKVAKYLFTSYEGGKGIDLYIKNSYVKEEVFDLDFPEFFEGVVATVLVFTILIIFTEKRRQSHEMRQQFETKHAELAKELKEHEALALLGRMTATLAHELKTPIATISNLVQVLPERISDKRFTQRFMVLMTEELLRTQQIIDNLLLYGKDIIIKDTQWIELKPFVAELSKKIGIKLESCPKASIYADKFYMRLFFENLLRNSAQAGADNISLTIKMSFVDSLSVAEIACEDNGPGFPEEIDLTKLIAPFVTSRSKGAGLGLYLAQKIAMAHGGVLLLFRLIKGAGITLVLPHEKVRLYG